MPRRSVLVWRAGSLIERLRIRGVVDDLAGELSGGNQQKTVFAKWLDAGPSVVVLDDPMRGSASGPG
jgi:ABC-type sugar transport system ATPase subunit